MPLPSASVACTRSVIALRLDGCCLCSACRAAAGFSWWKGQPVFAPRIAGKEGVIEIGSECRDLDQLEVVGDNAAGSQGSCRSTSLLGSSE